MLEGWAGAAFTETELIDLMHYETHLDVKISDKHCMNPESQCSIRQSSSRL